MKTLEDLLKPKKRSFDLPLSSEYIFEASKKVLKIVECFLSKASYVLGEFEQVGTC